MSGFETLLNKAKEASLITESEASAMLDDYNAAEQDKVADAVQNAEGTAFRQGYDEGYQNAKQQAEAETKKALDELLAKCDEEATMKLQTVIDMLNADFDKKLEAIDNDHCDKMNEVCGLKDKSKEDALAEMDAEHSQKLNEIYDLLTQSKEDALAEMDADHAEKLEAIQESVKKNYVKKTILEKIDADHAKKMKMLLEAKDASDAKKLVKAVEAVKQAGVKKALAVESAVRSELTAKMNKEIESLKIKNNAKISVLAESVDKYLNYALQKAIPTKELISEAKYNASKKALDKIVSILKINSVIQESKDGIFQEFEDKLKEAKEQTNKVLAENVELKNTISKKEAKLLLESKLANCTPDEAKYLRRYFVNAASPKIIEENIEDARSEYRRIFEERRQKLVSENEKSNVSTAGKKIVSESAKNHGSMNESSARRPDAPAKTVVKPQEKRETAQPSVYDIYADILKNN